MWRRCAARRHGRDGSRPAQRWGRTVGPIGFHGGKVAVTRRRVRERGGKEMVLPSWERAIGEDLPGAEVPAGPGTGVLKSAASRRFIALPAERMAQDLSRLDLLAVQIDGLHITEVLDKAVQPRRPPAGSPADLNRQQLGKGLPRAAGSEAPEARHMQSQFDNPPVRGQVEPPPLVATVCPDNSETPRAYGRG